MQAYSCEAISQTIIQGIDKQTLPQTFLITGPYGSGLNWMSETLVTSLFPRGTSDIMHIGLASDKHHIPLSAVHEMRDFLSRSPYQHQIRLCIIHEADFLGMEAQNALLKSIEEPFRQAYIIFLSHYGRLLPTIWSRCYPFELYPDPVQDIRFGRRDVPFDVEKDWRDLLSVLDQNLAQKSQYIETILATEKQSIERILFVWESVLYLFILAKYHNSRYSEWKNVLPVDIQDQVMQTYKKVSVPSLEHAFEQLEQEKESLLFSYRKKQLVLENILFSIEICAS